MTVLVAASEHALISLARGLVAPHAGDPVHMLVGRRELPARIGPTCAAMIEDVFAKLWPALWRRGARPIAGRSWLHHPPAPLAHTAATVSLLRWLLSASFVEAEQETLAAAPLALGDEVVIYLALDAAGDSPTRQAIARQPLVRRSALAWLGFADVMPGDAPSFAHLADGAGAIVVEALARELATRWQGVELAKRGITEPARLITLGERQDAALGRFMAACDKRRDLAVWVLEAAAPLLQRGVSPGPLALDPSATLGDRMAARVGAGALLRAVVRWSDWDAEHRAVRFIDDDYASAQRLLAAFERIGRAGTDRAAGWLTELAALAPTTSGGSASIEVP